MSRQLIYHKCSNCKKLVYAYCYDCNLALFDYKEVGNGKGHSTQRTFINSKCQAAQDFKLAVQSFLEYLCGTCPDYRVAMDTIEEYASSAWDSAYYKTHGLRTATIEDVVHPSDADKIWNNRTTSGSFTFREGVKG